MSVKQTTLKGEFSVKGKGLHTGKEVEAALQWRIAEALKKKKNP